MSAPPPAPPPTPLPARELLPLEIEACMDGALRPHAVEADRIEALLPSPCIQNHAAFLAFLPDGSLACTWFGGTMEGKADISIWMSTLPPGGDRWTEPRRMSDDPDRSEQNPVLFTAPDGAVWLFHTAQPGGRQDLCRIIARRSTDGGQSFSAPEPLGGLTGVFIRQPIRLGPQGEWLQPGFRCVTPAQGAWTGGQDVATLIVSRDQGATWEAADIPGTLGAVHMNPLPVRGGAMPAFFRDRFARAVQKSTSTDGGLTWSPAAPTVLPNNNSSIQAIRLEDGRIAMVLNPVNAAMSADRRASLYDEIEGDSGEGAPSAAVWGVPRAPMALVLSDDEGATFSAPRLLDTGPGTCLSNNSAEARNREYSYPSILQGPDGALHIAYTYHRRAIKYVRLSAPPR